MGKPALDPTIAIVGPCAAGKSTLAKSLQSSGYAARQIAQEHSYVPSMWQRLTDPDLLIYLDASFEVCTRRKSLNWLRAEYEEQKKRLQHARAHCQVYIDTDTLTPHEVYECALEMLQSANPEPKKRR